MRTQIKKETKECRNNETQEPTKRRNNATQTKRNNTHWKHKQNKTRHDKITLEHEPSHKQSKHKETEANTQHKQRTNREIRKHIQGNKTRITNKQLKKRQRNETMTEYTFGN